MAGRNPWKWATIAIVLTLLVGGVGVGAYLAGRSANDTASATATPPATVTPPATAGQTIQPVVDDDPSDGVLSESEYPQALDMIAVATENDSSLPRETLQQWADQMCSIARASSTGAEAHDAYKARLLANSPQVSEFFQEQAADIAASASLFVCLDDIPA